jgi:hypothetical protein
MSIRGRSAIATNAPDATDGGGNEHGAANESEASATPPAEGPEPNHSLLPGPRKQIRHRSPIREASVGPGLVQRGKDEPTLGEPGVGNPEPGLVDHMVAEDHEIQVEGPRPPPFPALPAPGTFDLLAAIKQGARSERSIKHHNGVQIASLGRPSDRFRLVNR